MVDIIVLAIIVSVITASSVKIYKEKKKGVKCVGCPYSKSDGSSNCSCHL